jgi:predicted TPR repeat methyltransferase/thioredoxin-like negative regulator of GroEL
MTELATRMDTESLLGRVQGMVARGEVAEARPLLSAMLAAAPPSPELWELEARVLLREGRVDAALTLLDRAIAEWPDSVELRLCRAGARTQANDLPGAARDAAEAVIADPAEPRAKALLGVVLLELGHVADALPCLRSAVAAWPEDVSARVALARACELHGDLAASRAVLREGVAALPSAAQLWTAAVLLEVRQGDFAAAADLAREARRLGAADACVLGLLGHALSCLGCPEEAAEAYAAALALAPEDPYVRHLVAAAGLVADTGRAPPEYVRVVFDGYAPRFDAHLMRLGYRVPGLARALLEAEPVMHGAARKLPVLDLGCGTGLMAVALSDLGLGPLVGVDLSPKMLALALQRSLYAELWEAELLEFLARDERRFGFMLAGDVLPYFGDLGPLFAAVASRLAPGGRFLLSAEALDDPAAGWRLGPQARYAHGAAHLREAAVAAGLTVALLRPEVVRFEGDEPVAGWLALVEGPAA